MPLTQEAQARNTKRELIERWRRMAKLSRDEAILERQEDNWEADDILTTEAQTLEMCARHLEESPLAP